MTTYWTDFAKSQDPNEPLRVSTPWPKLTIENEKYMLLSRSITSGSGLFEK
jgi:carboxylesterase type B